MCENVDLNICKITKQNCPFVYYCYKTNTWKALNSMPKNCKIINKKKEIDLPKGCYPVVFTRKGFLYVEIKGYLYKFKNPFDNIPNYVKLRKTNGKWCIIKE